MADETQKGQIQKGETQESVWPLASGWVMCGTWPAPGIVSTCAVDSASASLRTTGAKVGGLRSPHVRSIGRGNVATRSRSKASSSGSLASARKVGAFSMRVRWASGRSSAQEPGPSATVSTNCSAAPAWSPEAMRSTTAPILLLTSCSIGATEASSLASSENSGGSCAMIPRKRSGRSTASRSAIDAPNELPTIHAGARPNGRSAAISRRR